MSALPPSGHEIDRLKRALLDAFTLDGLRRLLRIRLDVDLEHLVPTLGQNGDQIAYNLVRAYAAQPGGLTLLLRAALAENPNNPALQDVVTGFAGRTFDVLLLPKELTAHGDTISTTIGENVRNVLVGKDANQVIIESGVTITNGDFVGRDKITINLVSGKPLPLYVNVPALPPHFLGREGLLSELAQRLCAGQTTALSANGLPRVGKTTLAVALARHPDVLNHFADGVLWAGLGRTPDVASIQATWAEHTGAQITDIADPATRMARINAAIGQRRLLIVLDDAWQLEAATALRCTGPNVAQILTTRDEEIGRAFAGASGCRKIPVLDEQPSYALLAALAPEVWATNAEAVRDLADVVDGLPLALELLGGYLAGSRQRRTEQRRRQALTTLDDAAARLALAGKRLGDSADRAVTLQETIALSLEGLPDRTVACFHALGAFAPKPARFDLASALAVTRAEEEALLDLIDRNLLAMENDESLALHQTLSDVARPRTPADAVARHREHYLALVDADPGDWQKIEIFYPQISFAWRQQDGEAMRFIDGLSTYQTRRGLLAERIDWLTSIDTSDYYAKDAKISTRLSHGLGYAYSALGDMQQALDFFNQALPLRRQVGDLAGLATTLNNIGRVYDALGDKQQALDFYNQALPMLRKVGNISVEATTLNNIGYIYWQEGRAEEVIEIQEQIITIVQKIGDVAVESLYHVNLAQVLRSLDRTDEAIVHVEQSIALLEIHNLPRDAGGQTLEQMRDFLAQLSGNAPPPQ